MARKTSITGSWRAFLFLTALTFNTHVFSQENSVSIGTTDLKDNAVLWLNGNGNQGFLLPTTNELTNISNPDAGMVVYHSQENKIYWFNGANWLAIGEGGTSGGGSYTLDFDAVNGNDIVLKLDGEEVDRISIAQGTQNTNQVLTWDGQEWVASSIVLNNIQGFAVPDQNTLNAEDEEKVLVFNGTINPGQWELRPLSSGGGVVSLDGLNDVNAISPQNSQVLRYNSTSQQWEPATLNIFSGDFNDLTNKPVAADVPFTDNNSLGAANVQEAIDALASSGIVDTDDQTLSLNGTSLEIEGGNAVDLSTIDTDTDDQTLNLSGTELTISDGNMVDLASVDTDTDDQTASEVTFDGTASSMTSTNVQGAIEELKASGVVNTDEQQLTLTGTSLSIENGNAVDLSSIDTDTDTDDQTLSLSGTELTISEGNMVDLGSIDTDTDTDDQTAGEVAVSPSGNLSSTDVQSALTELQTDIDNSVDTDDQTAAEVTFDGTTSSMAATDVQGAIEELKASGVVDTDEQQLTLTGTSLSIENGNAVDLSSIDTDTDTDDQTLSLSGTELTISEGNMVDLGSIDTDTDTDDQTAGEVAVSPSGNLASTDVQSALTELQTDIDNSVDTDDQTLSLSGTELTISEGNMVDLVSIDTDTDDQTASEVTFDGTTSSMAATDVQGAIEELKASGMVDTDEQQLTLTGTSLSIENGNAVDLSSIDTDTDTDDQTLSLSGTELTISEGNMVDLGSIDTDTDTDDQTLNLSGTELTISEGNTVDLASIDTDEQDLSQSKSGTTVSLNISGGTGTTIDISDGDSDANNELITGFAVNGGNLELTDAGGTYQVPLTSLQDGTGATDLSGLSDASITTPGPGHMLVFNTSSSQFENKALGGDATVAEDGTLTIGAGAITSGKIAADAVGTSQIADGTVANIDLATGIDVAKLGVASGNGILTSNGSTNSWLTTANPNKVIGTDLSGNITFRDATIATVDGGNGIQDISLASDAVLATEKAVREAINATLGVTNLQEAYDDGGGDIQLDGTNEFSIINSLGDPVLVTNNDFQSLGIGRAPGQKLDIEGSSATGVVARIQNTNSAGWASLNLVNDTGVGGYSLAIGGTTAANAPNKFYIFNNGAPRFVLDQNGNIGIGTENPVSKLQLSSRTHFFEESGATYFSNNLYIDGTPKYTTAGAASILGMNNGSLSFYNAPTGTAGSDATISPVFQISPEGNFGFGQTGGPGVFLEAIKPSESGVSEQLLYLGITDNPNGNFQIGNGTAADGEFSPRITTYATGGSPLTFENILDADNGYSAFLINSSIAGGTGIGDFTSLFTLENNGATRFAVGGSGSINAFPTINSGLVLHPYGAGSGGTSEVQFKELTSSGFNHVSLKAPNALASDVVLTLPDNDGDLNQVLITNGSGGLSWGSAAGVTTSNGLTYSSGDISLGGDVSSSTVFTGSSDNLFYLESSAAPLETVAGLNLRMSDGGIGTQYELVSIKTDATPGSTQSDFVMRKLFSTAGGDLRFLRFENSSNNIILNDSKTTGAAFGDVIVANGNLAIGNGISSIYSKLQIGDNYHFIYDPDFSGSSFNINFNDETNLRYTNNDGGAVIGVESSRISLLTYPVGTPGSVASFNNRVIITETGMSINIDGNDPSALLHMESTDRGLLIPRMTTAQRDLIVVGPSTEGLMIYNTITNSFNYYDGVVWSTMGDNLGSHTASQNIQLGSNYLSGDGDAEGISIDNAGRIGIGATPSSAYKVYVNNSALSTSPYGLRVNNDYDGASVAIGIDGVSVGNTSNATRIGVSAYAGGHGTMTSSATGIYSEVEHEGTGNAYLFRGEIPILSSGINYGLHLYGSEQNYLMGALLMEGSGSTPTSGGGTRLMWIPSKYAIRAGSVNSTQWDDINIGLGSASFGSNNTSSGSNSTTFGQSNTASGARSLAGGVNSIANGNGSAAIGEGVVSDARGGFAIGHYNVGGGSPATFTATDPVFEIGIGVSDGSRANAITVLNSGNVGIGLANPSVRLDVVGDIEYTGTLTDVSDRRLKENLVKLDSSLSKILNLNGYSYNLISDSLKAVEYGVVAQEVEKVLPHAVKVIDKNNFLGVSYIQLIPVLVEAIKEQQTLIENQQKEIDALKQELVQAKEAPAKADDLQLQLNQLKAQLDQLTNIIKVEANKD